MDGRRTASDHSSSCACSGELKSRIERTVCRCRTCKQTSRGRQKKDCFINAKEKRWENNEELMCFGSWHFHFGFKHIYFINSTFDTRITITNNGWSRTKAWLLMSCSPSFHLWILPEPLFQIGISVKNQNIMANSHYEPSHQDLHCLHMYLYRSTGLKRLNMYTHIFVLSFQMSPRWSVSAVFSRMTVHKSDWSISRCQLSCWLTLTMLGKTFSRRHSEIFYLIFPRL